MHFYGFGISALHILIIPSWYPSDEDPVSGIFFRDQAIALGKAGHRVGVLHPYVPSLKNCLNRREKIIRKFVFQDQFGITLYRFSGLPLGIFPKANLRQKLIIGSMLFRHYIRENGIPDIIHAHVAFPAGIIATKIKEKYGLPLVITEHHSAFARKLIHPWQLPIIRKSFMLAEKCIVVSPILAQQLNTFCNVKFDWVPNLVDTEYFSPAGEDQTTKTDRSSRFVFLFLGNLIQGKRVDLLLQAFHQAFKNKPAELWIGGDGIERKRLILQVRSLELASQVNFLGMLHRKSVLKTLRKCDALVLPSLYETFGVVLIEALSCGKPVISTRCGGPEYIVNDQNGFLVPTNSVDHLAEAMKKMVKQYHIFNPQMIRDSCVATYGERQIVTKLESVYSQAMTSDIP